VHLDADVLLERADEPPGKAVALPLRPVEPALVHADGHAGADEQARRDREALEILALARVVLGHERDGRVEPREARDAGADEEREEGRVDRGAQAEGPRDEGRRDAERDLRAREEGVSGNTTRAGTGAARSASGERRPKGQGRESTHRVGETVELLSEHAALAAPARNLAVERVEDHAEEREGEGAPASARGASQRRAYAIWTRGGSEGTHQRKRWSLLRRYSADEKSERAPQKPLPRVTQSARRKFLRARSVVSEVL